MNCIYLTNHNINLSLIEGEHSHHRSTLIIILISFILAFVIKNYHLFIVFIFLILILTQEEYYFSKQLRFIYFILRYLYDFIKFSLAINILHPCFRANCPVLLAKCFIIILLPANKPFILTFRLTMSFSYYLLFY